MPTRAMNPTFHEPLLNSSLSWPSVYTRHGSIPERQFSDTPKIPSPDLQVVLRLWEKRYVVALDIPTASRNLQVPNQDTVPD